MRALPLLFVVPMFAACGGDSDPGDVAAVFPESGFVGRKVRVEISGDTTSWDAGTQVSFGAGVTVNAVELISPSALQVDLTIDPTATPGKIDVEVTDGGDKLTLAQAFELKSPLSTETLLFEQGGFGQITVTNLDLLNPFDTTTDDNGEFINLAVASDAAGGVALSIVDASANRITLSALIDVTATETGPLTITSTTDGVATVSAAASVPVTPRTPVQLTAGGSADITVSDNGALLEITAAEAAMLNIRMTNDPADGFLPGFVILPASGKWDDLVMVHQNFGGAAALDNRVVAAGEKFYLVAIEFVAAGGYPATFSARSIPLAGITPVTDTGTNDAPNQAQSLTGTVAQFNGTLSDKNDSDCFQIAMATNQRAHVYTTDEDGASDTVIDVFNNNTAAATSVATSDDADLGEEVLTDILSGAATRSICVTASEFATEGFTNAPYKAFVVIE